MNLVLAMLLCVSFENLVEVVHQRHSFGSGDPETGESSAGTGKHLDPILVTPLWVLDEHKLPGRRLVLLTHRDGGSAIGTVALDKRYERESH